MLDFPLSANVIYCVLVLLNIVAAGLCFKAVKDNKCKKISRHNKLLCGIHGLTALMFAFTVWGSMTGFKFDIDGVIAKVWPQQKVVGIEDCPDYGNIYANGKVIVFDSIEKTCDIYSEDGSKISVKLKG